jgi:tetratricopeptide (TPR) repeat protein
LGAYLVARLVDTSLFPDVRGSDERDGFLWQINAVRRHIEELPADATETSHLAGIAEAVPPQGEPATTLRVSLTAYAYFLEHEGRLAEALEVLALSARAHGAEMPPTDFAACARFAARLNRLLTRWEPALRCFEAAEEAALSIGDQVTAYRARLGCGAVFRSQGNLPRARAVAEEILKEATERQLADVEAIAYGDLAVVYPMLGLTVEGLQAQYRLFMLTPEPGARMRALGDLGISFIEVGAYSPARLALNIVANSRAEFRTRTNAVIELMDLESIVGDRVAFERNRNIADTQRDRMPPSMMADYLYKTGMGFARFDQIGRARESLTAALAFAEANKLNTWYFRIDQALQDLERKQKQAELQPIKAEQAPMLYEMEAGLREYAALQMA